MGVCTVREKARRRSGWRKAAQKWQTCASATVAPSAAWGSGGARGGSSGASGPSPPPGLDGGEEGLSMAMVVWAVRGVAAGKDRANGGYSGAK